MVMYKDVFGNKIIMLIIQTCVSFSNLFHRFILLNTYIKVQKIAYRQLL